MFAYILSTSGWSITARPFIMAPSVSGETSMLKIAITGATGRMGRALIQAILAAPELSLAAALVREGSPHVGEDAGLLAGVAPAGLAASSDQAAALAAADVLVDFSLPALTGPLAAACAAAGVPLVTGTTGLDAAGQAALRDAAGRIPVLAAPNMSVGVTLALSLLEQAARVLGEDYDVEIQETHHRHKADAPSGTALRMGDAVAAARGRQLADCAVYSREGQTGPRPSGSIGFAVTRAGEVVGEHTVLFAGAGERLEIRHQADSRATFAEGALRAARWIHGKPAGLYSMRDVLGL